MNIQEIEQWQYANIIKEEDDRVQVGFKRSGGKKRWFPKKEFNAIRKKL